MGVGFESGAKDLTEYIRANPRRAAIPIIWITSFEALDLPGRPDLEAVKLGVDDYVWTVRETVPTLRLLFSAEKALDFSELRKSLSTSFEFRVISGGRGNSKYTLVIKKSGMTQEVSVPMGEMDYGDFWVAYHYKGYGGKTHPLYVRTKDLSPSTPSRFRKKMRQQLGYYGSCPGKFNICTPEQMKNTCKTLCAKEFWRESFYAINGQAQPPLPPPPESYWEKRKELFAQDKECFRDFPQEALPDYYDFFSYMILVKDSILTGSISTL